MKRILLIVIVCSAMLSLGIAMQNSGVAKAITPEQDLSQLGDVFLLAFFNNVATFFVCNPSTGEMEALNSFPGILDVDTFVAAIDPEHQHYFHPAFDNSGTKRLLKIDIRTGELVAQPLFSTNLATLQYHSADDHLYGVAFDSELGSGALIKIDPTTFVQSKLALPEVRGIYLGVSALSTGTSHYFFVGYDQSETFLSCQPSNPRDCEHIPYLLDWPF